MHLISLSLSWMTVVVVVVCECVFATILYEQNHMIWNKFTQSNSNTYTNVSILPPSSLLHQKVIQHKSSVFCSCFTQIQLLVSINRHPHTHTFVWKVLCFESICCVKYLESLSFVFVRGCSFLKIRRKPLLYLKCENPNFITSFSLQCLG